MIFKTTRKYDNVTRVGRELSLFKYINNLGASSCSNYGYKFKTILLFNWRVLLLLRNERETPIGTYLGLSEKSIFEHSFLKLLNT